MTHSLTQIAGHIHQSRTWERINNALVSQTTATSNQMELVATLVVAHKRLSIMKVVVSVELIVWAHVDVQLVKCFNLTVLVPQN